MAAISVNAPSQPHRIPKRIVPNPPHQSCPYRIGDDIPCHRLNIFFGSQSMVMIGRRPQGSLRLSDRIDAASTRRFETEQQLVQAETLTQRNQPVNVIRHQHPGKQPGVTKQTRVVEGTGSHARQMEIGEQRLALHGGGGEKIQLARQRNTASAQCRMT